MTEMIDEIKLKRLHELLLEDEEENVKTTVVEASANANGGPFDDAFRKFGVLPPKPDASEEGHPKEVWKRTITSSLFSLPVCSPPLTTIVPLDSLAKHLREKYISKLGDGEDALVEVPIAALISANGTESKKDASTSVLATDQLPSHRPLAGNLSSKLVEYTRGQVGKRNPFQPGGMTGNDADEYGIKSIDGEEKNKSSSEVEYPPYCSPKEIENAIEVLRKGSLAAWKDGTILTAPPGASYEIGLSLNDVHEGIDYIEKGCDTKVDESEKEENGEGSGSNTHNDSGSSSNNIIVSKMWDKSYFDDDSLFGDASSSSSNSSENENSSSDDENHQENVESEPISVPSSSSDSRQNEDDNDGDDGRDDDDDDDNIDDMDAFITELMQSTTVSKVEHSIKTSQKKSAAVNIHNPLHLADQRQPDKDRKSWAVTTSLNLKDFHSVVPNPAITYPFELDGFQKQAVARLERKGKLIG